MSGDVHVRFCESLGVRFPGATHRNIYVRSEQAGQRVMEGITRFITQKLKLKVNEVKSTVARAKVSRIQLYRWSRGQARPCAKGSGPV